MSAVDPKQVDQVIDELAQKSRPSDLDKLSAQLERKLTALDQKGDAPEGMTDRLRLFWDMLNAPDEVVPWTRKAVLMAAVSYFVSPVDLLPDLLGKVGYLDDAMVLRMVEKRLGKTVEAFRNSRG